MTKTGHQHVHEEVPIELLGAANDSEQQFQVHHGPWLLQISVVRFSLMRIFKK